jgi:hypothetical protein
MPLLALKEEAYPWAAVFSPHGNVHYGPVPTIGDPILIRLDVVPRRTMGCHDASLAFCPQPSPSYACPR